MKEIPMIYDHLPKDPAMLLGTVNMKLRDYFPHKNADHISPYTTGLSRLCEYYQIEADELTARLSIINYQYDEKSNQFK